MTVDTKMPLTVNWDWLNFLNTGFQGLRGALRRHNWIFPAPFSTVKPVYLLEKSRNSLSLDIWSRHEGFKIAEGLFSPSSGRAILKGNHRHIPVLRFSNSIHPIDQSYQQGLLRLLICLWSHAWIRESQLVFLLLFWSICWSLHWLSCCYSYEYRNIFQNKTTSFEFALFVAQPGAMVPPKVLLVHLNRSSSSDGDER